MRLDDFNVSSIKTANNELKNEIINFLFYSFLKNTWPRFTVSLLGDR